jgi:hypothetical protein
MVILVKVDESRVECAMIRRGERNSVSNVIRTPGSSNWENVRRVHQAKLDACHGTTIPIGKENLLAETSKAAKAAHFLDDALSGGGQSFDLLLGWLLEMSNLIKQPQDIRVPPVAMKECGIQAIGHEHVRADAYRYLVVVFSMETQTVGFRTLDFRPVDLDGRRTSRECPMALKVKTSEQLKGWFIADKDGGFGVGNLKGRFDAGHLNAVFVRQGCPSAKRECPDVNVDGDATRRRCDYEPPGIRPDRRCHLAGIARLSNCIRYCGYEFA